VPLVRCPIHGRVYDSAKDGKCPLCLQEESMPRAPGKAAKDTSSEDASAKGRLVLLLLLLFVVLIGGGVYWYIDSHNSADRAQMVRDSLRAAAAGPPRPDTTRFARASDYSPIRHARALRAGLESMLAANRGALMGWASGPIDTTVTDRAGKRHLQQYNAFYKHWMDRLDAITRNGTDFRYAPGVQYSLQMDNVTNQLQAAASVMRDMVRPYAVKPRTERQADIRAATGYLHAAGTVLTNLPH
jgi:hypothetical protein